MVVARALSLTLLFFASAGTAIAQRPDPIPLEASDYSELRAEIAQLGKENRFSGVVLIAEGDNVVFHQAYGFEDRSAPRPMARGTAFNIASVGKQLTAAAILKLAEQQQISLDAPIGRWIEGLPGNSGQQVTVRHLLRMESGWGDYMNEPAFLVDPRRFAEVNDYVALIRTIEPAFAPGSEVVYSNISYELLGAVIERVTGQSYAQALQDLILAPADMGQTGCFPHERASGRAVPYAKTYERRIPAYPLMARYCSPAGGIYSTAEDLLRFQKAVLEGELLSEDYARLLTNRFDYNSDWGALLAFIGGFEGANAWVETRLESGVTVIVLSNYDPPTAEALALGLRNWLGEK